jgi:hypothetical protein
MNELKVGLMNTCQNLINIYKCNLHFIFFFQPLRRGSATMNSVVAPSTTHITTPPPHPSEKSVHISLKNIGATYQTLSYIPLYYFFTIDKIRTC